MIQGSSDWKSVLEKGMYKADQAHHHVAAEPELTAEQEAVMEAVMAGKNICFTGSAGTGKSFTTKVMVARLVAKYGAAAIAVTASTGVAASHITGTTLHSFAGTGINFDAMDQVLKKVWKYHKKKWQETRTLIVDEASMIDGTFLAALDKVGRALRKCKNKPFGGMQVILIGDFLQLPPVSKRGEPPVRPLFESLAWKQLVQQTILLKTVHRQKNDDFVGLLQRARMGAINDADDALLRSRIHAPLEDNGILPTRIYTHNVNVQHENDKQLAALQGPESVFTSKDEGSDKFALEALQKSCLAPAVLKLKLHAQVLLLKNLMPPHLVNGSRGVIVGFDEDTFPIVQFDNGIRMTIGQDEWSTKQGENVLASRKQVPLCLAWAITIHKCQGMTLDKACIDISKCFEPGQAYVALSRCTSLDGISLLGYDRSKIMANPDIVEFYAKLGDALAKAAPPPPPPVTEPAQKKAKTHTHWWEEFN
jgi:ATP-dependent DNA helicase PIF1